MEMYMPFPVDNQFIEETEKELGIVFPPLFKAKMIRMNGGELLTTDDESWILYPFFDKSSTKRIARTCNHIGLETKDAREWTNFPSKAIAIGSNGCGDQLILLPNQKSTTLGETIYIWRHEDEEGCAVAVASNINNLEDAYSKNFY